MKQQISLGKTPFIDFFHLSLTVILTLIVYPLFPAPITWVIPARLISRPSNAALQLQRRCLARPSRACWHRNNSLFSWENTELCRKLFKLFRMQLTIPRLRKPSRIGIPICCRYAFFYRTSSFHISDYFGNPSIKIYELVWKYID